MFGRLNFQQHHIQLDASQFPRCLDVAFCLLVRLKASLSVTLTTLSEQHTARNFLGGPSIGDPLKEKEMVRNLHHNHFFHC